MAYRKDEPGRGSRAREQMLAWTGVVRVARHLLQGADEFLQREFALSFAEKSLLGQLAMDEEDVPMAALAQRLVITKAGLTKMVDRLEASGWVRRQASAADRRVTTVVLTPQGRRLHERIKTRFVPWIAEHFADHLTVDELRLLRNTLLKVVAGEGGLVPETLLPVD